jgi:hypothetical protein
MVFDWLRKCFSGEEIQKCDMCALDKMYLHIEGYHDRNPTEDDYTNQAIDSLWRTKQGAVFQLKRFKAVWERIDE